jgi:Phospholipase_D-nuclease N-terminal/Short C-terminal domain
MQLMASISFGQVLLTVLEIALLATWIWVAVSVILDIFRSPDLSNAAKAGWIFVILFPVLGVLLYVIVRGDKMSQHEVGNEGQLEDMRARGVLTNDEFLRAEARRQKERGSSSRSDDVAALEDLRDHGVLTDEEFRRAKEKAVA